jgi:hypothetical protein
VATSSLVVIVSKRLFGDRFVFEVADDRFLHKPSQLRWVCLRHVIENYPAVRRRGWQWRLAVKSELDDDVVN